MTMSDSGEGQDVLVIEDTAGNMYLIRRETLEAGRVSDEYKEQVWQAIQEPETSGYGLQGPGGAPQLKIAPAAGQFQVAQTFRLMAPPQAPSRQITDALRNL
jgi:hypothetical protein